MIARTLRLRLTAAEDADLRRALDLTRSTPRGLLMTAVSATLAGVESSICVRAVRQRDELAAYRAERAAAAERYRQEVSRD